MRFKTLAAVCASASFVAVPALAQGQANTTYSTHQTEMQTKQGNEHAGMSIGKGLAQGLEKAGFTNVRIEPEVFVVHATNSQGEPVLMRIGPDSMESLTAMTPNHAKSGPSASNTQNQNQASMK